MPTLGSVGTERRSLEAMIQYLMDAPKPPVDFVPKVGTHPQPNLSPLTLTALFILKKSSVVF
jgi:hypothetical protein